MPAVLDGFLDVADLARTEAWEESQKGMRMQEQTANQIVQLEDAQDAGSGESPNCGAWNARSAAGTVC